MVEGEVHCFWWKVFQEYSVELLSNWFCALRIFLLP